MKTPPAKKHQGTPSISTADLDWAILNPVQIALAEQKFDTPIWAAVKEAMDSVAVPQLVKRRRTWWRTLNILTKTQINPSLGKTPWKQQCKLASKAIQDHHKELITSLTRKLTKMEDRCRGSNLRLVGQAESAEGSDAFGFLKTQLPQGILSLVRWEIRIEKAHRLYSKKEYKKNCPRILVCKMMDYVDRQAILKGAKEAYAITYNWQTILFPLIPPWQPLTMGSTMWKTKWPP